MATKTYLPRLIDEKVKHYLLAFGAVCIEGPKWKNYDFFTPLEKQLLCRLS